MRDLYRKLRVARSASSDTISFALNARRFTLTQVDINDIESVLLNSKRREIYDPAHKTMQTIVDIRARTSRKTGSLFDSELAHDFVPTPKPKKQASETKPRAEKERTQQTESTKSNRSYGESSTDNSKREGRHQRPKSQEKKSVKRSSVPACGLLGCFLSCIVLVALITVLIAICFSVAGTARKGRQPTSTENPYVTWTDNTGKFSDVAKYVDVRDKNVVLLKPDGKELEVPIKRLSVSSFNLAKDYYERAKAKAKSSRPIP